MANDRDDSRRRTLGLGDVLMVLGLVGCLVVIVMLLVWLSGSSSGYQWADSKGGLITSTIVLLVCCVGTAGAFGLSFRNRAWLVVMNGWAVLVGVTVCFGIGPLTPLKGTGYDFMFLLAGLLVAGGSYLARCNLFTFVTGSRSSALGPTSTETTLMKLKQLLDQGVLSGEEYAAQRKRVLDELIPKSVSAHRS